VALYETVLRLSVGGGGQDANSLAVKEIAGLASHELRVKVAQDPTNRGVLRWESHVHEQLK
jgi:hypothetical protein